VAVELKDGNFYHLSHFKSSLLSQSGYRLFTVTEFRISLLAQNFDEEWNGMMKVIQDDKSYIVSSFARFATPQPKLKQEIRERRFLRPFDL
jgi:hypothetical protein